MTAQKDVDWSALGLRVGIEIHQQLDTGKLFCGCPSELEDDSGPEVERWLRPAQSEMGEVDKASLLEARRHLQFVYQNPPRTSCLVDIDEEPPHDINAEALKVTLMVAKALGARTVDELHVMRKIVIDGSNTTGFQRTALVAMDGSVSTSMGDVPIGIVCLEEDAARKMGTRPDQVVYRVDRLGIPLVEVATGPVMRTPVQVKDVAHTIGLVLRATKKVRRGLGTIRQDLNVSITGGDRVEIKGVQELNAIPFIVQEEVRRQLELIDIREELERRGVGRGEIPSDPVDVTEVLKATSSKVIKRALEVNGKVLGIRLPGLKGLLDGVPANEEGRHVTVGRYRLGAELAAYARTAGVMGIFESDELPGYGITQAEVDALADALGATGEHDAFAIVAEVPEKALAAVAQVIERARLAFDGVPQEVRGVRETRGKDGEEHLTEFQRPMPGAARMYPETDIPPVRVTEDMLDVIDVPEMPDARIARFVRDHGLNEEQAGQLVHDDLDDVFEPLCRSYPDHAAVIARTLLSTIPELAREGICIRDLGMLDPIFKALDEGRFAKEGVPEILWAMIEKGLDLLEALDGLGLSGGPDLAAVRDRIKGVVVENMGLVKERGRGAVGPLMGILMKEFRGKVDGKVLSDILREELDAIDNDAN